ncbi:hypothetical protein Hs30E_17360 [Lactococcus hodotermopsidis]|uniref:DUF4059 domain-containing protein n=1 Tax=Pseudolactococcus hodotermopsidis TaxID=2709157 RepID=A0A6A0BEQ6_9LACT|nr:DUF4059 family protein [Lactococcus hodotermopsidis]GFH43185.1 hypothetical protein Hs30E_17360 [Lactococcus hodotermopsidis]
MSDMLSLYLKSLLISAGFVAVVSGIYALAMLARHYDKPKLERKNKIFDILLIDILIIPILSFAIVAFLIILKAR